MREITPELTEDDLVLITPNYETLRIAHPLPNLDVILERHGTGYSSVFVVQFRRQSPLDLTEIVRFTDRACATAVFERLCRALLEGSR